MGWSYEKEQARLENLMQECLLEDEEEQTVEYDDQSDADEEENIEMSTHNSESEQEISGDEVETVVLDPIAYTVEERKSFSEPYFEGKDKKSKWYKNALQSTVRSETLKTHLPGAKSSTKDLKSILEIWHYFVDLDLLGKIVEYTNQHIISTQINYSRDRDAKITDITEIQALIGLLYLTGILKSSRLNVDELWNTQGSGVELFRLAMGKNRFKFLLQHLRFDDMESRTERKKIDKLAPIREFFKSFVNKCKTAYTPCQNVTIDEKLDAFRGRCGFRQYMPNKPNKYGIKLFALTDSKTFYTIDLEVYLGKQPDGPYSVDNSPSAVVQRLCQCIKGTHRNVTCDNWFTGIDLIKRLLTDYQLTFVGTIRKNKRELPVEFSCPVRRPVGSSMFGFQEEITLVSYIPKRSKNVLLVSSLHHDDKIDVDTEKPVMIMDYNSSKGGVDCLDKLCETYNCARNTKRWPMVIFYSVLNISGINSMVLYFINNDKIRIPRRQYLRELSFHLIESHLRVRTQIQNLPKSMKLRIRELTKEKLPTPNQENTPTRGRCAYCDRKKNRPTRMFCKKCYKFLCGEHSCHICAECFADNIDSE